MFPHDRALEEWWQDPRRSSALRERQQRLEALIQRLEADRQAAWNEVQRLEAEQLAAQAAAQRLQLRASAFEAEARNLREKKTRLEEKNKTLEKKIEELETECEGLRGRKPSIEESGIRISPHPEASLLPENDLVPIPGEQSQDLDLRQRYLRLRADLENLRRRQSIEVDRRLRVAKKAMLEQFLPVMDAFDGAEQVPTENRSAVLSGLAAIRTQMADAFRKLSVERIAPGSGDPFDPEIHEAISVTITGKLPEGDVAQLIRPGYRADGTLLRPAQVTVARPPMGKEAK